MKTIFTTARLAPWVVGCAVIAATPTRAEVFASAQLSNFNVELIDLDPADGLAPSLDVLIADNYSHLVGVVSFASVASESRQLRGVRPFDALSADLAVPTVASFASIVGGGAEAPWQGAVLQAEGRLLNLPGNGEAAPQRYFSAGVAALLSDTGGIFFLLGPNSAVTMTATAQVTVSKDFAAPVGSEIGEAVVAMAGLELSRPFYDNGMTVMERIDLIEDGGFLTRSRTVTAAMYNASANTMPVALRAFVSIDGTSRIAAVPEPQAWALWATGLATVGGLCRRRRRGRRETGDTGSAARAAKDLPVRSV